MAGNKEVIGTSQMYKTRDTLRKGRDSVIKNANDWSAGFHKNSGEIRTSYQK